MLEITNETTTKQKIEFLRWKIGLNISEIATLLMVKKNTVYRYINGESNPRMNNYLTKICCILERWSVFNCAAMGKWLHVKLTNDKSLFDLLIDAQNQNCYRSYESIVNALGEIEGNIVREKEAKTQRQYKLKELGFRCEPPSIEKIKKGIDRVMRKISSREVI